MAEQKLTGLALTRAREKEKQDAKLSANADVKSASTAGYVSEAVKAVAPPSAVPFIKGAEAVSTVANFLQGGNTKAQSNAPTGVLNDSASVSANFMDSIKRGGYNVSSPTQTQAPQSSTVATQPAVATTPKPKTAPVVVKAKETISTGPDFNKGAGREDTIVANIATGRTATPDAFRSRNTFNQAYGYDTADETKKAILDREFAKYNAEDTAKKSVARADKGVATGVAKEFDILSATPEQIDQAKKTQLEEFRTADTQSAEKDLNTTLDALKSNNKRLTDLYGINPDGSIDESRPNSLAMTAKNSLIDYKKIQNENADKFESARKSRVVAQIYQKLASRGIDVSKIPQEQLIALSDEVGAQAFGDIYQAKTDTINRIQAKEDATMNTLNTLKEKGAISENDYTTSVAQVQSAFEKTKTAINKNFANDIFGLADKAVARKETKSTANLNFLNALTDKIGIPLATASKYVKGILKKLPNATPAQVQAELLANADFVKEANSILEAKRLAAQAEAELKQAKTLSEINKNKAQAVKASRPASTGTKTPKSTALTAGAQVAILKEIGIPLKTVDDVANLRQSDEAKFNKIAPLITKEQDVLSILNSLGDKK